MLPVNWRPRISASPSTVLGTASWKWVWSATPNHWTIGGVRRSRPMYSFPYMLAVVPLLAFFLGAYPNRPTGPQSFPQIAKQADEARVEDRVGDAVELYSKAVHLRPS